MKRFLSIILACCMLFALAACNANEVAQPSGVPSEPEVSNESIPESSTPDEPASSSAMTWSDFTASMAEHGIPEDNLHTLENLGYIKSDIMKMSAEEIKKIIDDLKSTLEQNKIDRAKEILDDLENARNDDQFVFTDYGLATANFNRVTEAVNDIKANDHAGFTGVIMSSTMPFVYKIDHTPNSETTFTKYYYMSKDDFKTVSFTVTDIYECESFIQFTDNKDFRISLPKIPTGGEGVIGFHNAPTPEGAMSIDEVKSLALEIGNRLNSYVAYAETNSIAKPYASYGIVIPEDYKSDSKSDCTADVDKTLYNINNIICYKVTLYNEAGNPTGDTFFIECIKGENVFTANQANGGITPLAYKGYKHTKLENAN